MRRGASNVMSFYGNAVPEVLTGGLHKAIDTWQAFMWTRSGSFVELYQNGIRHTTSGSNGGNFSINQIGPNPHGIPFVGDMGEVLVWDKRHTYSELIKFYDLYLREKWGLPGV